MQVSQIVRALPVVFCLATSAAAQTPPSASPPRYRIPSDNAWLYNEPSGRRIARLARGAEVAQVGTRDQWVQVLLDGWIFATSVGASSRPDFDLLVTKAPNENLRVTPGAAIVAVLSQGFGLARVGQDSTGRWIHVTRTGWVQRGALGAAALAGGADTNRRIDTSQAGLTPGRRPGAGVDSSRAQPARMTTLYRAPDGPEAGSIAAETPLRVLSRNGEWTRVQFEGWVKGGELQAAPSGVLVGVTAAELRAEPSRFAGQVLRWKLEFIALQRADELRPDIPAGAQYMLARGPLPERGFVYVVVPETRLAAVRTLTPLETVQVTARVRNGRSRYLGNPIVDLIMLEEDAAP
jgi:hypothetical protein